MKKTIVFLSLFALLVVAPGAMALQASRTVPAETVDPTDPNLDQLTLNEMPSAGVQDLSQVAVTGEPAGRSCCLGPGMNTNVSLDANTNPGGGGSRPVNSGGLSN